MILRSSMSFVLVILSVGLLLFSCKERKHQDAGTSNHVVLDLEEIQKRGYITAIMINNSTSLFLYQGKTMGYEYELLKRYTDEIGVDLRIDVTLDLEEGFEKLISGKGDVLAYNLTVTRERKKRIAFTHPHRFVRSVLVQRKPDEWRKMKLHEIEAQMLRSQIDLIGKQVQIRCNSSYAERLRHLSDEIGGDIEIIEREEDTEHLIRMVAEGKIDFTVAEEDIAYVNQRYYPNLDIETPVSFEQQIAWGVRKNAPELLSSLNIWLDRTKLTNDYFAIYDKYYKSTLSALRRKRDQYFSKSTGALSPYDSMLFAHAKKIGWDWRLLAALVLRESKFDASAQSGTGALGLMQLLPETGATYGVSDLLDPKQNIIAGTKHLKWLIDYWQSKGISSIEMVKFVLASYNVGHAHVYDAVKLAEKYGADPLIWNDNVASYIVKKEQSQYYSDPVVKYGFCKGSYVVAYVDGILASYDNYLELLPEEMGHLN